MTKKDKIKFIRTSRKGAVVAGGAKLEGYTQRELDEMIQEIAKKILAESEAVTDSYLTVKSR